MDFPYPKTNVFTRKEDTLTFIKNCTYPMFFEFNTGSVSSAIEILGDRPYALIKKIEYILRVK